MNKRGGEKVFSIYWFLMFGIVAIVVVSGVLLFFSKPVDVRDVEAKILRDRVIDCFVEKGMLKEGVLSSVSEESFGELCNLRFDDSSDPSYGGEMQYYIMVESGEKTFEFGRKDMSEWCGQEKRTNVPHCVRDKLVVLDDGDFVLVSIDVVIDKVEQNAK